MCGVRDRASGQTLVHLEASVIDLALVLDTFETHPSECLEVEYFAIIILIIIIIERTSI